MVKEMLGSVNVVQGIVKCLNSGLFNDRETVVNKAFPCFRFCKSCVNGCIFNHLHAEVGHNWADWATHGTAMNLFLSHVVIDEIVVESVKSKSEIMSSIVRLVCDVKVSSCSSLVRMY
jgi:hypothetical protein